MGMSVTDIEDGEIRLSTPTVDPVVPHMGIDLETVATMEVAAEGVAGEVTAGGEVAAEAVAGEVTAGEAGAFLLSGPNETMIMLCPKDVSTISLPFPRDGVKRSIGKVGGVRKGRDLLYYVWLDGPFKGCHVDADEAPAIMRGNEYKTKGFTLIPVWSEEYEWEESPGEVNRELQKMLEDTQVDEYGSFIANA
jgi:hypothetical protein